MLFPEEYSPFKDIGDFQRKWLIHKKFAIKKK